MMIRSKNSNIPLTLEKFSIGIGDRFGKETTAQLRALEQASKQGIEIVPVWNKSYREHSIVGTTPEQTREAADFAVNELRWDKSYYVDADHIGLKTVDLFTASSDFFTLDVADFIGSPADPLLVHDFVSNHLPLCNNLDLPGVKTSKESIRDVLIAVAQKYLLAIQNAGMIYRHIEAEKGIGTFIVEVSVDEAMDPQTPLELFFILAAIAKQGIPVQTIAPKFTGQFLKGIDYVGPVEKFVAEFEADLIVVKQAIEVFNLPSNLKLSVHSGSDKFSLYPHIHRLISQYNAGLHLKTAGTTWLEELVGLSLAGGDGLLLAKEIYAEAYHRREELCKPYEFVVKIDHGKLPSPLTVQKWSSVEFASALRHEQTQPAYNPHLRQLLHVGYKLAAEKISRYMNLLDSCRKIIGESVTDNLFRRHISPVFIGK